MGRRHAKNIKNNAYTFEVAPREHYGGSRERRRHPEEFGQYVRVPKRAQEVTPHEVEKLPKM